MSELDELSKAVINIRGTKYDYGLLDFYDVSQYCIAKRDETLTIFLEMENFIQNNIDIFYNPKDTFVKARANDNNYGLKNEHNRVRVYITEKNRLYVWIDQGIMFTLNNGKVVYISRMESRYNQKENSAFDHHKFYFFDEWVNGSTPEEGYSRFSFTPTMGHYFPNIHASTLTEWSLLKKKVDDDYNNAVECRKLLIKAVKEIQEDEQKYLDDFRALKESSKEA